MLVLKRRIGERLVIAGNIHVVVHEIRRGRVLLGITAPTSVSVLRGEIIKAREEQAATAQGEAPSEVPDSQRSADNTIFEPGAEN